jgi:hypothetical protein
MTVRAEESRVLAQLWAPLGQPGSGRLRYAAAMHFYNGGRLPAEVLEVYRICSPKDGEDPEALLRARGLTVALPRPAAPGGDLAIRLLVEEADRYFAGLAGPGVAEVRAGLAAWRGGPVRAQAKPSDPVVDRWMPEALEQLAAARPALAAAIAAAVPHLHWLTFDGYPVEEVGAGFARGHAYASVMGEEAAIAAADWELGLFLIPPHVLYRDHRHRAPELYAPLTGPHGWRFGPDRPLAIRPAHRPIWNDPFVPHLTKVGPVPFLCFYVWTRDVNAGAEIVPASDWADLEDLRLEA